MLICHSCGTPVESKSKQCHHCRNAVSIHAAVGLLEPEAGGPLKVQLELQPRTLDNLIAADLIKAASKHSYAAADKSAPLLNPSIAPALETGHNGHNGENTGMQGNSQSQDKEIDFFARIPEMFKKEPPVQEQNIQEDQNVQEGIDWQAGMSLEPSNIDERQAPAPAGNQIIQPVVDRISQNNLVSSDKEIKGKEQVDGQEEALNWSLPSITPSESDNNGEKGGLDSQPAATTVQSFGDLKPSIPVNRRSFTDQKQSKKTDFNLKSSWPKLLALGLVAVFILFKGFEAFCGFGNSILTNSGNPAASGEMVNSLSGRWQFAARGSSGSCQGQMVIHQRGNQLFGEGIDNGLSQYRFNGSRSSDHIDLVKQYFVSAGFIGHPIRLQGDLDSGSKPLFMHGDFVIDYMQGGKWRGKPVVINGIWEAEMIQPLIEDDNAPVNMPAINKFDAGSSSSIGAFGGYLAKYGVWMVLIAAALGWGAWHTMSSLIGPDGWFGIWDKQKYVPPQFMKEHRIAKKQLSQPLVSGSLPLGRRWEWQPWQKFFFWIPKDLAIPPDVRANNPHVLILGGGEKGKSRLMAHMIAHDIESADRAVVVVDSDGDLADHLLRWVAAHPDGQQLAKRVIVIDPTSNVPAPSFNPLEWPEDADMQNASSSIVHGFKAIYHEPPGSQNQWSPQTAHILRNAAVLLMANSKTLIDLPTLLQDNDFRDIMLEKIEKRKSERVEFATLLETWGQYKRLARTEQWITWYEPILNRVSPTLTNLRIRPILTQAKGEINLKQIIAEKKILIVKIPKGQLHDDANLLGSLIVTGLKQAAITLCTDGKVTDRTAALYLDEFDNFIEKETLDAISTETKKFQLGFVGSTKTLQHMPEDFRNQIVINIGTMCVFALSKKDGDMIGPQMFRVSGRKAKHRTLMNILNKVNTSPQFELISDEEKYNIDRILGQTERQFYAYRVGTVAGTFRMKCHDFNDIADDKVDKTLVEAMYKNR